MRGETRGGGAGGRQAGRQAGRDETQRVHVCACMLCVARMQGGARHSVCIYMHMFVWRGPRQGRAGHGPGVELGHEEARLGLVLVAHDEAGGAWRVWVGESFG